jgi:putative ABC transport system permease protein
MSLAALLRLAWRESRFARRRLFLFLSAISLGVAALVAVQGFASNTAQGVRGESLALLGADLSLSSLQPFGERSEVLLDSLRAARVPVARVTSFSSMAVHLRSGSARLVQVRAPEPGFPFYGEIRTEPAGAWEELHRGRNAVVDPALLAALGAVRGDSIALGQERFRIVGELRRVPGSADVSAAFAPRVFIPADALAATELVGFGSRVEFEAYVQLPGAGRAAALLEAYRPELRAERVRSRTADEQQEGLQDALGRLYAFLGLIGALALLLGGIGVASAMGAYMSQKTDSVAVLRCLGATSRQVLGVYLAQAAAMGLLGALLGVALGAGVQWVLPRLLAGLLPVEVEVGLDGSAMLVGLGVGLWAAVVFALLPLLRVRRVSPLGALRRHVEPLPRAGVDVARSLAWVLLAASIFALLLLQVREPRLALGLAGGIAATLLLLWLAAWALTRLVRRARMAGLAFPLRQGLSNLHRPGNQTRTVVLALGFGVFLLATLLLVQHNLLVPLQRGDVGTRANLFLWDVQDDQTTGVEALLAERGAPVLQRAPIVPMRVAALKGVPVRPWTPADTLEPADGQPRGWALRREYRSTFRDTTVASERLVEGRWWQPGAGGGPEPAPISLERDIARDLGVEVGDRIDWDVQGVVVPTTLAAIREVDWMRFEPNFFAVFPVAALEAAPTTWVLLSRGDTDAERAAITTALVRAFTNVAVLDLTQVQEAFDQVLGRVTAVIRFLAAFSVVTGFLVLLGAISTSRLQRIRESVLLKTLGATRNQIAAVLFAEYLLLGLLAGIAGTVLAVAGGWALSARVFDIPFAVAPVPLLSTGAAVALLAVAVGLGASREVFRRTPMEAIREE